MAVSGVGSATSATQSSTNKDMSSLSSQDFLKLLITELSNQDPFEPMKNQDLLNQVSSIRELESTSKLTQSLESLVLQGNLASASNLIGKQIAGMDIYGDMVVGEVKGVVVSDNKVLLHLDGGTEVEIGKVTEVAAVPTVATDAAATSDETGLIGEIAKAIES